MNLLTGHKKVVLTGSPLAGGASVTSRTTTTRTTTTTNEGGVPIITTSTIGGTPMRTVGGYTTTYTTSGPSYVSSTGPMMTQYTTTSSPTLLTTSPGQVVYTTSGIPMAGMPMTNYRGMRVGTLSTIPWSPMAQPIKMGIMTPTTTGTSAQMMVGSAAMATAREAPGFSSTSSIDINGVHCEGRLEITGNRISGAKNIFMGISPFVLDASALQVTPELAVMTVHPDIKAHIADIPCPEHEFLTMEHMREMIPGHQGTIYLALPGQQAVAAESLLGASIAAPASTPINM